MPSNSEDDASDTSKKRKVSEEEFALAEDVKGGVPGVPTNGTTSSWQFGSSFL
jgi:hypothetical protein